MSVVKVHGSTVHDSTVIDNVVHAIVNGLKTLNDSVHAMREERIEPEDIFQGEVYDRINQIMEEASHGN